MRLALSKSLTVKVTLSTMVRAKELSKALRKKNVPAYESGKGFKKIPKDFDISHSTVWKIVYKW